MTKIVSKLKTLLWYLERPSYYGQMFKLIKTKAFHADGDTTREIATGWCKQNAVTTEEALRKIVGNKPIEKIELRFASEFEQARLKQKNCPVKMGGPGDLNLLYNLAEYIEARNVIETGVAYGWSSLAILFSISKREGLLCSTDMPYPKINNDQYVGIVVPDQLRKFWNLVRLPDEAGLKKALAQVGQLDLCHYDSDKSYAGRMFGYHLLWNALRKGGIFISDDINDNLGFYDFCKKNSLTPIIVSSDGKFVGIIIKN